MSNFDLRRRVLLRQLAATTLAVSAPGVVLAAPADGVVRRPIGDESLPVIGMGSYLTFDVGGDRAARDARCAVLEAFFAAGGALVDSSPMYASSEEVLGYCLSRLDDRRRLFAATKVWKFGAQAGVNAMEKSRTLWGVKRFDLMQIHNMLDWRSHLPTLIDMKQAGAIRYIGITTSHGRRHADMAAAMAAHSAIDSVQFTYNVVDREAENKLLPLAFDQGKAVIINRPFQRGFLLQRLQGKPLPGWAAHIGCEVWAQVLLKFIISHPAVTCAIPATSRVDHMRQNMAAMRGALPDAELRQRIATDVGRLL